MSFNELQLLHLPPLNAYDLIELALMHESYINENCVPKHKGERMTEHRQLAHLGDSIMNAAVTDYLFEKFPDADQGVLSNRSQPLKARKGAVLYAQAVGLDRVCKLGGSVRPQDRKGAMFGEMFEALMGAIYRSCDRDFGLTRDWFQARCATVIEQQLGTG